MVSIEIFELLRRVSQMKPPPTHIVINCGHWPCEHIARRSHLLLTTMFSMTPRVIWRETTPKDPASLSKRKHSLSRRFSYLLMDQQIRRLCRVSLNSSSNVSSRGAEPTCVYFPFPGPRSRPHEQYIDAVHFVSEVYREVNMALWPLILRCS
jgi:hypothetical protein